MNNWIKCTDRVPKDNRFVLITVDDEGAILTSVGYYGYMGAGIYGWSCVDEFIWMNGTNVIAWQPLPEPYEDDSYFLI